MRKKKRNIKFYILSIITFFFALFIFIEEVMPYEWSKAQNNFVSNVVANTINFFKGKIYYDINSLELKETINLIGSKDEKNSIGVEEILVLKYEYSSSLDKEYNKKIKIEVNDKSFLKYSYEFIDNYLYVYIQSKNIGKNEIKISNYYNVELASYTFNVVDSVKNLDYDIILDKDIVDKNYYLTYDYSFYNYIYDDYISKGFRVDNNLIDYHQRSNVLTIGSSNMFFSEYDIINLYKENYKFKTSNKYIEVEPNQRIIMIDKNCPSGIHYIENEKGNKYYFTVSNNIYTKNYINPEISVTLNEDSPYLSNDYSHLMHQKIEVKNMDLDTFIVRLSNNDNYFVLPYYYMNSKNKKVRSKTIFYVTMKEVSTGDTLYVESISEFDGIKIKSNVVDLVGYDKTNVPKSDNSKLEEFKAYDFNLYLDSKLLNYDDSFMIKKGEVLVFDILINNMKINMDYLPLYAYPENKNIIEVRIDKDESKLYVKCLDLGESKLTFINYYNNNYNLEFYTDESYQIKNLGDKTLGQFVQKNIGHILCYIVLGLLVSITIYSYYLFKKINIKVFVVSLLITIIYSFIAETIQHFIPNRDMSILDYIRNSLGIVFGYFITIFVYNIKTYIYFRKNIYNSY